MKKILVAVGIILVILVGIKIFYKSPTLKTGNDNQVTTEPNMLYFENEYIRVGYPDVYILEQVPSTDGRVRANLKISSVDKTSERYLLLLREMSQELDELEDIRMRRRDKLQYTEEVARINELRGFLFRTADRKERSAYFKKNGRLLVVTLTSTRTFDEAESEFQQLLERVEW